MNVPSFEPTLDERAIIGLLVDAPVKGDRLLALSNLERPRFISASERLWNAFMLMGTPEEGCCRDPCGINCVSALDPDAVWTLTAAARKLANG